MSRWAKAGVLDRVFEELQLLNILRLRIEIGSIDSTSIKVPRRDGCPQKGGPQAIDRSRGELTTKLHLAAASLNQILN